MVRKKLNAAIDEGRGVDTLLFLRLMDVSLTAAPIVEGIEPAMRLEETSRDMREVRRLTQEEVREAIWLLLRRRVCNFGVPHKKSVDPLSWLKDRSRVVRELSFMPTGGAGNEVKPHRLQDSFVSEVALNISTGISPERPDPEASNVDSVEAYAISFGIVPVRCARGMLLETDENSNNTILADSATLGSETQKVHVQL